MLKEVKSIERSAGLDRAAWHKPLISIVITHYNYADHIEDAILSLLDQTYENWECVVVDDASSYEQHAQLVAILDRIGSPKIRLVEHSENLGQIPAFFTGLDATSGNFVCLLDPDDRYTDAFLEEALAAHLNNRIIAPIISTDQYLVGTRGLIGAGFYNRTFRSWKKNGAGVEIPLSDEPPIFVQPDIAGWHISSTSALMMRRIALNHLKPARPLPFKGQADSYLATGLHWLGGTIFLPKPLIFRTLHPDNAWLCEEIFSTVQEIQSNPKLERATRVEVECELLINLRLNGAPIVKPSVPHKKPGLLAKWRRSFNKRWQKLFGKSAR